MDKFEIEIANYVGIEDPIAEIYYSGRQWAQIFCKDKDLVVQFYPLSDNDPHKKCFESPFEEAFHVLEKAKDKLLKKLSAKNSPASMEQLNPEQINQQAQEVIENILNHPQKTIFYGELKRFGKIKDIYAPGLGGVRYTISEEFIGFLEP